MLACVVAMATRLIDRFETDNTRNLRVLVPLLGFGNRSRPRRRSRPRPLGRSMIWGRKIVQEFSLVLFCFVGLCLNQ